MRLGLILAATIALSACVRTSVMPLAADTVQITARAAPACGAEGAEKIAIKQAAIETLKAGYDRFVIINGAQQNKVGVVGTTPVVANTYGTATAYGYGNTATAYGQSTTTYSGGTPIFAGTHDQSLIVKMFHASDPNSGNALDAKTLLGPNWRSALTEKNTNCFDD